MAFAAFGWRVFVACCACVELLLWPVVRAGALVVALFVLAVSSVLAFFAEPQPLTSRTAVAASGQIVRRSGLGMARAYCTAVGVQLSRRANERRAESSPESRAVARIWPWPERSSKRRPAKRGSSE